MPAANLTENFNSVSTLLSNGWVINNQSFPAGSSSWFQGNTAVFAAQSGAANSYVAANFEAAGASGNISDWLITPSLLFSNGDSVSFFTRSDGAFADRLEVRYSTIDSINVGATATSVGDFSNLLLSVNPGGAAAGYPTTWTRYIAPLSGLSGSVTGRLAFRYVVSDTSVNGDYIGIDTLNITGVGNTVPEPATLGFFVLAAGFLACGAVRRLSQQR